MRRDNSSKLRIFEQQAKLNEDFILSLELASFLAFKASRTIIKERYMQFQITTAFTFKCNLVLHFIFYKMQQ